MGIGVFGAMISSVTGLVAQSQALGIIFDTLSQPLGGDGSRFLGLFRSCQGPLGDVVDVVGAGAGVAGRAAAANAMPAL